VLGHRIHARALRCAALASFVVQLAPSPVRLALATDVDPALRSALHAAVRANEPKDVLDLARRCRREAGKRCGLELLMIRSIRDAKPYVAIALIQAGAAPNARDTDRESALAIATERGNIAVVRALLAARADPDLRLPPGDTAMHRAAAYGRDAVITVLAEAGAEVDAPIRSRQRRNGWTPLMVAVAEQQLAAVERLLAVGAKVDARNPRGRTALLLAAWYGAGEIAERLLRAGADAYAADVYGFTPARMATLIGDDVSINYFRAAAIDRGR
jgi:ankyrin repeat protein